MQSNVHPASWYAVSAPPLPPQPALAGRLDADVCVVGGGYTGLSAALHLAGRGYSVALLEARRIGWGASGRNGGNMATGFPPGMARVERLVGPDDARRLWDMSLEARALVRELAARHDIACDLTPGYLYAAVKPRHMHELAAERDHLLRVYGYEKHLIGRDGIAAHVSSEAYLGGLLDPQGGHLHPLSYAHGLARAALGAGVRIFENTAATGWEAGARPVVRTERGEVGARFVVLACGAYLQRLAPGIRPRIMPVATYLAATEPLGEARAKALIPSGVAVEDVNFVLDYFHLSGDHRLLFGGGVSYSTIEPRDVSAWVRPKMLRVFPQLADVRLDYGWSGFVDITRNRLPDFGQLAPTVFYAQGFSGQGVCLTSLAGKLMAEAISGTAERFDVFARIPHRRFPGGKLLRTPLLVLATLYFRLRDMM